MVPRRGDPKLGRPLRRLPVLHPRVVEPCCDQHGRILGSHEVLVRGVRTQPAVLLLDVRIPPLLPLHDRQRQRLIQHRVDDIDERHLGNDGAEAARIEVDGGADGEAPGAPTTYGNPMGIPVAGIGQVPGRIDQVGERVHLVGELALLVPRLPHLATAANMSDRVHDAAVQQTQPRNREPRRHRDLVCPVGVDNERRRTVDRHIGSVNNRHRNPGTVARDGPLPMCDIGGRVVATEHRLLLEELPVT